MENYITITHSSIKLTLTRKAKETLEHYRPKGCPFTGYSLLDLLNDMVIMYSWMLENGVHSIGECINTWRKSRVDADVYGDGILICIGEEV